MLTPIPFTCGFDRVRDHLTVYLGGELDCETASELEERVLPHIHASDRLVWLDLTAVTFCGSAGLTLFLHLHRVVGERGGQVVLYRPSPAVMRTIQLCRLDHVLAVSQPPAIAS
jgi:anti-anti-sigma factor